MDKIEFFGGVIVVLFTIILHVLDGMHLMEWLKRSPAFHKILMSRGFLIVLIVAAMALMGEGIREFRQDNKSSAQKSDCSSGSTGPTSANGNGNVVNSGNCAEINGQSKGALNKAK
jgi:hypothetical protein